MSRLSMCPYVDRIFCLIARDQEFNISAPTRFASGPGTRMSQHTRSWLTDCRLPGQPDATANDTGRHQRPQY